MKKTVVFDFDGVIHSYTSGWKGCENIPDPPVDGIKEVIDDIRKSGFEAVIVSTRCANEEGVSAIHSWLNKYEITVDNVCKEKPPAICYVDDRAIQFDGKAEGLVDKIKQFKSWAEN